MSAEAKTAAEALLTDSLAADKDPVLVRALRGNTKAKDASKDEATAFLQSITLKAAAKMIEVALSSGKGEALFAKLEAFLDQTLKEELVCTGLLSVIGDLAGACERATVKKMLNKCGSLFDAESHEVRAASVLAMSAALKTAIA